MKSCVQRDEKKVTVCIRNVLFPARTSKYTEVILTCIKQGNWSTKPRSTQMHRRIELVYVVDSHFVCHVYYC